MRCVEKLEQLPKLITRMMCYDGAATAAAAASSAAGYMDDCDGEGQAGEYAIGEEDRAAPIYVKVVRPSGTCYSVVDLPGAY